MSLGKNVREKYEGILSEWFLNGFNGLAAYKKYYPNVKDKTAKESFVRVRKHKEMQDYIVTLQEQAKKIIEVTHEGVLQELKNWIESDITQTIGLSSAEIKALPIEVKRLINKFKETTREIRNGRGEVVETIKTIEIGFICKVRAMDMISRQIGAYSKDNAQKATKVTVTASNDEHKDLIDGILSGE